MSIFHWHKWHMWSEPKDWVYYNAHLGKNVDGRIQERTCSTCGKYQWRKI